MYREAKGGMITLQSFLREEDRNVARDHMLRTASLPIREAAKIGLQSLYADPEEVFKKYKDFDIVQEMQARKGVKLLWVRARAIDADTVNANGDYFSKAELLKDVEVKGEKKPAYKTFEGVPIYTNHKNDDIEQAKGMVVYAEWDEEENCVWCTFFVDEEAYPDLARNIRTGTIHDVSMGCQVESGVCSKCGNVAATEKDYCECLKKYKGKKHPQTHERIYEKNLGIKFIELSAVGDGAFDTCEIEELYDVDEILDAATSLDRKAGAIFANIVIAESLADSMSDRQGFESDLRLISSATKSVQQVVRTAQTAGTLVGGQLLAGEGSNQNSTVAAVLNALGIDPRTGLNILDLLNLSLNFLEVAVMNMFARKDNIDLSHVGKITKSMADLQATMQDMIDDGVDTGGGKAQQPINQGALQNAPQGGAAGVPLNQGAPQAGAQQMSWSPAGAVGRMVSPMSMPAAPHIETSLPGMVQASADAPMLVWASKDEGKREVFASRNTGKNTKPDLGGTLLELGKTLVSFKDSLGVSKDTLTSINKANENVRAAQGRNKNIRHNAPTTRAEGNNMDHFEKIASEQRKKLAASVTIDFKVEDASGNRVVLSTNGDITGYKNGVKAPWEPLLNEQQLQMMEGGQGARVAAELLKDFATRTANWHPHHDEDVREVEIADKRKNPKNDVKERELGTEKAGRYQWDKEEQDIKERQLDGEYYSDRRDAEHEKVREDMLGEDAGLYGRGWSDDANLDVREHLIEQARLGNPEEVIELQLDKVRKDYGPADAEAVMVEAINALGKAVVAAKVTPEEIVAVAASLAAREDTPELIALSSLGNKVRLADAKRRQFHRLASRNMSPEMAVVETLGDAVSNEITAADLADAIRVAAVEKQITLDSVTRIAESLIENNQSEPASVNVKVSREERLRAALASASKTEVLLSKDHVKAVISAMAVASEKTGATPAEVVACIAGLDARTLTAKVNEARTATATEARITLRARRNFWGNTRVASKTDVEENTIGWIADYATNFDFPTNALVEAARKLVNEPKVAEKLVVRAIIAKQNAENNRTAAITITQEKSECIRFVCRAEDLGGLKPNDEGFDDAFRQQAIDVLSQQGFTVDPGTFSFTDLNVTENGDITATVSSRTSKSFKAEGSAAPAEAPVEELPMEEPPVVEATPAPVETEQPDETPTVMTAAAKAARVARRKEILKRYSQMMPGQGAGMGAGMGVGADMGMGGAGADMGMGGAGAQGLGLSAFTAPTAAGDAPGEEAPADTDAMSEPGTAKPWGSVCPQCGSTDTNLANSEGECNSCGAHYKVMKSIELIDDGKGGKEEEAAPDAGLDMSAGLGGEAGLGADTGLGAATAPAPEAPAPAGGAPMGGAPAGGAPMGAMAANKPTMFRIAYTTDSDVYLGTASPDFQRTAAKRLPVGMICPKCGNREAHKIAQSTICYDCGTYARTDVKKNPSDPTKLDVTITWID